MAVIHAYPQGRAAIFAMEMFSPSPTAPSLSGADTNVPDVFCRPPGTVGEIVGQFTLPSAAYTMPRGEDTFSASPFDLMARCVVGLCSRGYIAVYVSQGQEAARVMGPNTKFLPSFLSVSSHLCFFFWYLGHGGRRLATLRLAWLQAAAQRHHGCHPSAVLLPAPRRWEGRVHSSHARPT